MLTILYYAVSLVVAYFVADLIGALYHLATDYGYNTKRIVANFRNHHAIPESMTFDLEPMLGGIPLCIAGYYLSSPFIIMVGVFLSFAQIPHYFVHHPSPNWVKWLQQPRKWLGGRSIFLPPIEHQTHHESELFNRNFSVINGWANPVVNSLIIWLESRKK